MQIKGKAVDAAAPKNKRRDEAPARGGLVMGFCGASVSGSIGMSDESV